MTLSPLAPVHCRSCATTECENPFRRQDSCITCDTSHGRVLRHCVSPVHMSQHAHVPACVLAHAPVVYLQLLPACARVYHVCATRHLSRRHSHSGQCMATTVHAVGGDCARRAVRSHRSRCDRRSIPTVPYLVYHSAPR
eukprot:1648746-Prymnesium_polylepis.1